MNSKAPDTSLELELEAILNNSKDNFVVTDGQGVVLRVSPNCYAIYGTEPGYFIGKTVHRLEQEGIFNPSVTARVLAQGTKTQIMQTTRTGRLVLATGVPVFDESGVLSRVVSSSYDLTEIQLLRDEFERLQVRTLGVASAAEPARQPECRGMADLAYRSAPMRQTVELVLRIARADVTVLFLGETGVGKTALARFLHANSHRSASRFVALNCSAVPEPLFESQLFGYESGTFTGADRSGKIGLIELADGGTLFLDEIGDLPLAMQAKLLTVLEERTLMRLGSTVERRIDFRIVASSNHHLRELVDQGRFRADLYYRLSVFPITVPPLRLRRDDIAVLIEHCLRRLNTRYGGSKSLAPGGLQRLLAHPWPGNIRELKNVLERLWLATASDRITVKDSDLADSGTTTETPATDATVPEEYPPPHRLETLRQALENLERTLLLEARNRCRTTYEIAEVLGISQPSVVRRLKKYGIDS